MYKILYKNLGLFNSSFEIIQLYVIYLYYLTILTEINYIKLNINLNYKT